MLYESWLFLFIVATIGDIGILIRVLRNYREAGFVEGIIFLFLAILNLIVGINTVNLNTLSVITYTNGTTTYYKTVVTQYQGDFFLFYLYSGLGISWIILALFFIVKGALDMLRRRYYPPLER